MDSEKENEFYDILIERWRQNKLLYNRKIMQFETLIPSTNLVLLQGIFNFQDIHIHPSQRKQGF